MTGLDLTSIDTTALAESIREKKYSATDVMDEMLARIEQWHTSNILVSTNAETSRNSAVNADRNLKDTQREKPLAGVPFVVKDNMDCLGWSTTCCTSALNGFMPTRTAPVVSRLLDAGAILVGKASLHELASGVTSFYPDSPERNVLNPIAPLRMSGGSSSGTAAAIASGLVPFGIGTDTGGSLRIPAACCGVYGFRPSCHVPSGTVRYNREGLFPVSPRHDTPGPMARSLRDLVLLDGILSGEFVSPGGLKTEPLRIGLPLPFWSGIDPDIADAINTVITRMKASGHQFVPVPLEGIFELNSKISSVINIYDPSWAISSYFSENGTVGPSIDVLCQGIQDAGAKSLFGKTIDSRIDQQYEDAVFTHGPAMSRLFEDEMMAENVDCLLYPTIALKPWLIEEKQPETINLAGRDMSVFEAFIRNTTPVSSAGLPAVTLPIATTDGVPVGLELCGRIGRDSQLLQDAMIVDGFL